MFTGIVQRTGTVVASRSVPRGGARISIRPDGRQRRYAAGESVSVSGVCLTALEYGRDLVADLSAETLSRTNLAGVSRGRVVNLERSLRWGDPLSGHFVMGHVDAVTRLISVTSAGNAWTYRFAVPGRLGGFLREKGSVALDGVSLTVARRAGRVFDVAVIPETRRRTTLGTAEPGDLINLEADIFARYGPRAIATARREAARDR